MFSISLIDFIYYEIKNEHLIFLIIVIFLKIFFGIFLWEENFEFFATFLASFALFIFFFALNYFNYVGGGDVKLSFLLGMLVGYEKFFDFVLCFSILGGIFSLLYVIFFRGINQLRLFFHIYLKKLKLDFLFFSRNNKFFLMKREKFSDIEIPYGTVFAMSILIVMFF